ncbi:MAG: ROK family protein [Magnetococcales bacterium]|nr:ROK family protein [Magnetococcales bacterium]MBF0114544.1 ROK family protein [Magnetococcales bacterium]
MRIGIDLGGSKIEAILLHPQGEILRRERLPTPQGDYAATLQTIATLVARMETHPAVKQPGLPVGVGIPGAISLHNGRVKNANSVCLIGKDLTADLQQHLDRPVRLANDADCFTLSEATDGAAAQLPIVFGVILGTGVGGGIAVQGTLLQGVNAICGEWGHNPLPWPTPQELPGHPCYCGQSGCIETFLSGPGLCRHHLDLCGEEKKPDAIVQAAAAGDAHAETSLRLYESRLARALASVINLLDPFAIVLGGGLANIARWYQTVPTLWQAHVFSDRVTTRLLPAKHGDSSGVRGAAWLWPSPSQQGGMSHATARE